MNQPSKRAKVEERRHFEIEVDEESFLALRNMARKQRKPAKELANQILKRNLSVS